MRKIAFICFEGFQSLDLTGPMEVFDLVKLFGQKKYDLHLLSEFGGLIKSSSGMLIKTEKFISLQKFDCLIVIGGDEIKQLAKNQQLISYIQRESQHVTRLVSICSGAFLLAEAGLLSRKKITTHWSCVQALQSLVPSAEVIKDAIYIKSDNVYTSAGISAGMDLALSIIEEDYGKALSLAVAKELVIFYHRPGGQKQFSDLLQAQSLSNDRISLVCTYIHENLAAELTVTLLAEKVSMSPRNFSRLFTEQLKLSPGKYVQQARIDRAKHLLEQGQLSISQVGDKVGINSIAVFSRLFKKHLAISPNDYKERFYKAP